MPRVHGGNLDAARALFPGAPRPFIDLSTAINPHPYPIPEHEDEDFSRLPAPDRLDRLARAAAELYGAPSKETIVAAPGSQILVALIAELTRKGRAAILGPTYAEHARVAALAGHEVSTVTGLDGLGDATLADATLADASLGDASLGDASLAVVVNPNNPDGRLLARKDLLAVARQQSASGGLLIVDEAFMDVRPSDESLSDSVDDANIVVLRSFGKFFGLAGLRLSFAVAPSDFAARLRARLGPWPVSGPALSVGLRALNDEAWIATTRAALKQSADRLASLLCGAGLKLVGGTDLFHLVRSADAQALFTRLGEAGIYVRRFDENPHWLRFGLPGPETAWTRLTDALNA